MGLFGKMTKQTARSTANAPDKAALARLGAKVRGRLKANREAYKLPTDKAEIFAVGDFLDDEECDRLISMIDQVAKPSKAFFSSYAQAYRTSYSGDIDPWDPLVQKIQRRIDDLLGIPSEFGETIQGQRYLPGQEFKQHCDWFFTDSPYWEKEWKHGGQRSWTAMVFLNDVDAGGTTEFVALGLSIEPKRGALLAWNNAMSNGLPNKWTLHAALPVEAGVKYVVTKWYRTRKWG